MANDSHWYKIYARRKPLGIGGQFRSMMRERERQPKRIKNQSYRSQKHWCRLPFVLEDITYPMGYLVKDNYLHYKLQGVQEVLWVRKSQKVITETYVKHAAKTNGWHIR